MYEYKNPHKKKSSALTLNRNNGFTLVELVIVVVSMAIIFGVGYANYRNFQKRQHLETAVRMVKADLRLAQAMAVAGRKPTDPPGNACLTSNLNGYTFRRNSNSDYQLEAICGGGTVIIKGPVELPLGTEILAFGSNVITFRVLARGASVNPSVTITLQFPTGGVTAQTILVTSTGEIR